MKNTFDLSSDEELRDLAVTVAAVLSATEEAGEIFLIGAAARDLLLHHAFSQRRGRLTLDVDVAVHVSSWNEFEVIRRRLTSEGATAVNETHRFTIGDRLLDVVPFGDIEENHTITWSRGKSVMNVLGFEEASANTVDVLLPGGVAVRVATIPALLLLKFFAWEDRHVEKPAHDAVDIRQLITTYPDVCRDLLYEDHIGILEVRGYDLDLAAAVLLGREVASIAGSDAHKAAWTILDREVSGEALARDMSRDVDGNLRLLQALRDGFASYRQRR